MATKPLIMIVDDDKNQRTSYESLLYEIDFSFESFENRRTALNYIDEVAQYGDPQSPKFSPARFPAAFILDQNLQDYRGEERERQSLIQGAEGLELIRPILNVCPYAQIFMITAYAKTRETQGFKVGQRGAIAYWEKNGFSDAEMQAELRAAAERYAILAEGARP